MTVTIVKRTTYRVVVVVLASVVVVVVGVVLFLGVGMGDSAHLLLPLSERWQRYSQFQKSNLEVQVMYGFDNHNFFIERDYISVSAFHHSFHKELMNQ